MAMLDGVAAQVTIREAAVLVQRTPETVRRWVWSGRLAASRDGNRLLVARSDVERLLDGGEGERAQLTLEQWADLVSRTFDEGVTGSSAGELVLADRSDREGTDAGR